MKITKIALIFTFLALCLTAAFAQNSSVVPASAGSPGGSDTQVQYNNSGAFGASSKFYVDKTTGTVTIDLNAANGTTTLEVTNSNLANSPGIILDARNGLSYLRAKQGNSGGGLGLSDYNYQALLVFGYTSPTGFWTLLGTGTSGQIGDLIPGTDLQVGIGDATHSVKTIYNRSYVHAGAVPSGSGNCAIDTQVGGNTAGTFQANGACVADTVILTFALTAPNGWACFTTNRTAVARIMPQTASSTTTATLTGSMTDNDVVQFACSAY